MFSFIKQPGRFRNLSRNKINMSFPRKVLININSEERNIMYLFKYIISIIINTCLAIGNVFCLGLKIISFVFFTLIDNLLAFSQVETLWSWSLRWEVSISRSLFSKNILVSSANNINSSSLELEQAGRSLI